MTYDRSSLNTTLIKVLLVVTSLIYIYTAGFGFFSAMSQRAILLALLTPVIFLTFKKGENKFNKVINIILSLAIFAANFYVIMVWQDRILKSGSVPIQDIVVGSIVVLILLEATRRSTGWFLTLTAAFFLVYGLFGPYFPGFLAHRGESWNRLINFLFMTSEGIYGIPLGIAATFIIIFVIFGSFLEAFGGGQWFVDTAYAITGRYRGGPAKTAVVASALMGMISGAPAANVATTGTFTIPLMKKVGYKPHVAAAIEAVASTGGMFTPPIMGAGAFIMAEYLEMPYSNIIIAAIIPALLFYLALMLIVDAQAVKNNLKGLHPSELPKLYVVMRERGHLGLPVIMMIVAIVIGWSPTKAAFWATVLTLVVSSLSKVTRPNAEKFISALENGARQTVPIVIACATAGIIVGVISITGLGAKLSYTLIQLSNGNMYIAAFLTMVISLILGCAMPPTAVYIILAAILVPPLANMGIAPIAAHMFIFIFSSIGALTPPVAITAYTGAAIAGADPNLTGVTAFRFGLSAYIIPFMFITDPSVILQGSMSQILSTVPTATVGVLCLVACVEGYFIKRWNHVSRVLLGVASLLLLFPGLKTDLAGLGLIIAAWLINRFMSADKNSDTM
ncbi:MAG: TRAP transporter permease [Clostridia bacterium]